MYLLTKIGINLILKRNLQWVRQNRGDPARKKTSTMNSGDDADLDKSGKHNSKLEENKMKAMTYVSTFFLFL
jgi:hypothetical protein